MREAMHARGQYRRSRAGERAAPVWRLFPSPRGRGEAEGERDETLPVTKNGRLFFAGRPRLRRESAGSGVSARMVSKLQGSTA